MKSWKELLLEQERLHPKMQLQDFFKLAFQAEFGAEHAQGDIHETTSRLEQELSALTGDGETGMESLGGGLCRLHLRGLREKGLETSTLAGMFRATAQKKRGSHDGMQSRLEVLLDCCREGALPFPVSEAQSAVRNYRQQGYPAVHHSAVYRAAYAPAYRVVEMSYWRYLEVFAAVDRALVVRKSLTVAIDGNCAAGKTTLGSLLASVYPCNLFHMDDFFLRPEQRTPERFAQPGGNVDRERFADEVLAGIRSGKPFRYQRFDCSRMELGEKVTAEPRALNIVEGSYSLHPMLESAYGLKIFLALDGEEQSRRILARNGPALHRRFMEEWVPLENRYFRELDIPSRCHLVLDCSKVE